MLKKPLQRTILLVEDETIIALHKSEILEDNGYAVLTVCSGEKAIQTVEVQDIDLILMDIELGRGKMDGTEAAGIILREHDIPIVFLSSRTEPEIVKKTESITSYGFIDKKSKDSILLTSIKMAFRLFEARQAEKKSEYRFRQMFMQHSAVKLLIDHENGGQIIEANQAAADFYGYGREEFQAMKISDLNVLPAGDIEKLMIEADTQARQHFEFTHRLADGSLRSVEVHSSPIMLEGKRILHSIIRDITGRKKVEEQYRLLAENISDSIIRVDAHFRPVYMSPSVTECLGYTLEDFSDRTVLDVVYEEDREKLESAIEQAIVKREERFTHTHRVYTKSGELRWMENAARGLYSDTGVFTGAIYVERDITERKKIEEKLKDTIEEKNFLMKEMNHRVKNNLLMINSLIQLKNASAGDLTDLSDLSNQVDAIRLIHEKLHQTDDCSKIEFGPYIKDLLTIIFSFSKHPVQVTTPIGNIYLETQTAIPLGLIINEIATNVIQHGMNGENHPLQFSIGFDESTNGKNIISISHSGKPIPESIDIDRPETFGFQLMKALAEQIEGTIELNSETRRGFIIRLPIEN